MARRVANAKFPLQVVFESTAVAGMFPLPDDWQPRHNIKQKFEDGTVKLTDDEAITSFSNKFIVEKDLVKDYLQHLTNLERMKNSLERSIEKTIAKTSERLSRIRWEPSVILDKLKKLTTSRNRKASLKYL